MNYSIKEVQDFLDKIPSFQKHGKVAYKPGVESMAEIDALMGYPSKAFRSLHVAGTNGKGSTSHMLAAALMQLAGADGAPLKVGLYTSPQARFQSLAWEDPLEEEMATHSSILCPENPMHRGAWRAIIHRVTKNRTRLK